MGEQKEPILAVFDVGTQSARTMLVNDRGEVLGIAKEAYTPAYRSPQPDWAEQDADYYYERICSTCRKVLQAHPDLKERLAGAAMTTIRDTVVCVDQEGRPLRPAILWLDKRLAMGTPRLPALTNAAVHAAGMTKTMAMQFQKSHCNWLMEEEPEIWAKTYKYLLLSGYLTFKITGEFTDARACQIGRIPFDNKKRDWMSPHNVTYPVFPIEKEKLCTLKETGEILGRVTRQMSQDSGLPEGLPLYAGAADQACQLLGLGCLHEDMGAIGLGTTATFSCMSDHYVEPQRFMPPYAAVIPGKFNPEIQIYRGYWLISWFKKEFADKEVREAAELGVSPESLLDASLARIPAGCDGLVMEPYFTPSVNMPDACGAIIGFSDQHTRLHIYRAIVEGIGFALMEGRDALEKQLKHPFTSISVGGGGSQSDEICQITADMFGLPVLRTQSYEATGIGCAMAAFVGMGRFSSYEEAVAACVHTGARFEPREMVTNIYRQLYERVYKDIYRRLRPLYGRLHDIYKENQMI
jgi:sugar (pentulose or hexulose) kinase